MVTASAEKDKNAPRKNRSAYIIWAQEYREKHFRPKASTPQAVSFRDQATQLGNAWKKMTDKDKKKYVDAAMRERKSTPSSATLSSLRRRRSPSPPRSEASTLA